MHLPELTDRDFMEQALAMAKLAQDKGEVPVGAVVVFENQVIAQGYNQPISTNDPTAHAEIIALREAGLALDNYRLPETILYVTLEPCAMCAGAMIHARIKRLVFGAFDPRTGAAGSVLNLFEIDAFNHRVVVEGGVLEDQCSALLKDFFKARR